MDLNISSCYQRRNNSTINYILHNLQLAHWKHGTWLQCTYDIWLLNRFYLWCIRYTSPHCSLLIRIHLFCKTGIIKNNKIQYVCSMHITIPTNVKWCSLVWRFLLLFLLFLLIFWSFWTSHLFTFTRNRPKDDPRSMHHMTESYEWNGNCRFDHLWNMK